MHVTDKHINKTKHFLELKITEKTDRKNLTILSCMVEKCKLMHTPLIMGSN